MLMLFLRSASKRFDKLLDKPHPFPDWPSLEGQALWILENEVRERKDRPKPVILVRRKVVRLADGTTDEHMGCRKEGNLYT